MRASALRRLFTFCALAAGILWAATDVWAQGKGGGGNKGGNKGGKGNEGGNEGKQGLPDPNDPLLAEEPVTWTESLDEAIRKSGDGRYILVFTHKREDADEDAVWRVKQIVDASEQSFSFYWFFFDKEHAVARKLGITRAPALLGLDRHGNEFKRSTSYSATHVLSILKETPKLVQKYLEKIRADLARGKKERESGAKELLESPLTGAALEKHREKLRNRALKYLLPLALDRKVGYEELKEAGKIVARIAEERFAELEEMAKEQPEDALRAMENFSRQIQGTEPGTKAAFRAAARHWENRNVSKTLAWLGKCGDDLKEAVELREAVLAEGEDRIKDALVTATAGDVVSAKKALEKIKADYKGTRVAESAERELQKLK